MLGNHPAVRMRVLHPVAYLLIAFGLSGSFNVAAAATVTISGSPPTSVAAGNPFAFTPTASSSSRWRQLRFTIANKPAWATFSTATGKLSGTPATTNIGTTSGVQIKVTDGRSWAQLPLFAITVTGTTATTPTTTGSATVSWQPPTQNSDGTALTSLAGYQIDYGTDPNALSKKMQVANPAPSPDRVRSGRKGHLSRANGAARGPPGSRRAAKFPQPVQIGARQMHDLPAEIVALLEPAGRRK
jgi:hypothetical protein